jgi:CubicO group peptidase (beta-lactamase class C family)
LRWVLSHQAGLPYPDPDAGLSGLDQLSGPALVRRLERQAPWWPPGSAFAYHPITSGAMLGEVVRRVTGRTLGEWFAEHVARPLDLEFWIGLPAALDERVAPSVWAQGRDAWTDELALTDPPSPGSYAACRLAAISNPPPMDPDPDDHAARLAYYGTEVPAESLGHTGAGGRLGLADPELDVSFGYVCNSMRAIGPAGDPRWTPLLAAVRSCS